MNKGLGAGLASIALAGVGAGIGIVFGSLIHSVSRNPSLSKQLFGYAILGFALSESMALFALLVAFLILFVLPGASMSIPIRTGSRSRCRSRRSRRRHRKDGFANTLQNQLGTRAR